MSDTLRPAAYEHNGARVEAARFYAVACDPRRHVAIEACAGAGKTWVLVSRIVRALLAQAEVTPVAEPLRPDGVLAITFTRRAAAEMRERLNEWLHGFSQADPQTLGQELRARGLPEAEITPARCAALQGLYGRLLASGHSVQIRTFHSWFASLLRVAPMSVLQQLGLPQNAELLDEDEAATQRVWRPFHQSLSDRAEERADYMALVREHGRSQTEKALEAALARRSEFACADRCGAVDDAIEPVERMFPSFAGLEHPAMALATAQAATRWQAWAQRLGQEGGKTAPAAADRIVDAFLKDAQDLPAAQARLAAIRKALFVADEDRLKVHLEKFAAAQEAASELETLCAASAQHDAWLHQRRMARLTRLLIAQYRVLKRQRGWIDMADVEDAAQTLLGDPVVGAWVQERLDQNIRHLLIDEFQDTNPMQWRALVSWLGSYAGASASPPSLFFVGDPKQSIYRFRRAEPAVFLAAQDFVRAGLGGDLLSCDHTRRNAPGILDAINRTMTQPQVAEHFAGFRHHTTESKAVGTVLALPQVQRPPAAAGKSGEDDDHAPSWRDSLEQALPEPEEGLRAVEAAQVAEFIEARIAGGLAPQDILLLSRTRVNLIPMRDALRDRGIAAQIGEKTLLAECPEVEDLVALIDVLASPGHDISLARVLKSPLFGLGDADLIALALRRRTVDRPWLELLWQDWPVAAPGLGHASACLRRWQGWVRELPPHDALQAIYDDGDVLAAYAEATPPSMRSATLDNLRALLAAALDLGGGRFASPYALVRAFRAPGGVKAPAALQADAVRLLTIHGAKGLEAELVVLLDTDKIERAAQSMSVLLDWPAGEAHPRRFMFLAREARPPACARDAMDLELAQRRREENNALYVALTRARTELVVSSIEPHRTSSAGSWWNLLQPVVQAAHTPGPKPSGARRSFDATAPFSLRALPAVRGAVAIGEPVQADAVPDNLARVDPVDPEQSRLGQALHRLLQWGDLSEAAARAAASEFDLDQGQAGVALAMALRIRHGDGAWVFDAQALSWAGNEVELHLDGQLLRPDRLVRARADGTWWVLDYKAASAPHLQPDLVEQLRRYRAAVSAAYPGEVVRSAFLTGQGGFIEARDSDT